MKQDQFDRLNLSAAACQWGVAAVDAANRAKQPLADGPLDRWLDEAEPAELRSVSERDPDLHDDLRAEAAEAAEAHARLMGCWAA